MFQVCQQKCFRIMAEGRIPWPIWDRILEYLSPTDIATFRLCCSQFAHYGRRAIHRHVSKIDHFRFLQKINLISAIEIFHVAFPSSSIVSNSSDEKDGIGVEHSVARSGSRSSSPTSTCVVSSLSMNSPWLIDSVLFRLHRLRSVDITLPIQGQAKCLIDMSNLSTTCPLLFHVTFRHAHLLNSSQSFCQWKSFRVIYCVLDNDFWNQCLGFAKNSINSCHLRELEAVHSFQSLGQIDSFFQFVSRGCSRLRKFGFLSRGPFLIPPHLIQLSGLIENNHDLEDIRASECEVISADFWNRLPRLCPNIRHLDLGYHAWTEKADLPILINSVSQLHSLECLVLADSFPNSFDAQFIRSILRQCKTLKYLALEGLGSLVLSREDMLLLRQSSDWDNVDEKGWWRGHMEHHRLRFIWWHPD